MKIDICKYCKNEFPEHIPSMKEDSLLNDVCSQECYNFYLIELKQPERSKREDSQKMYCSLRCAEESHGLAGGTADMHHCFNSKCANYNK
jgi:hypothetical protein